MPNYATNANALAHGLRDEMEGVWEQTSGQTPPEIAGLFQVGDGDGAFEDYHAYRETGTFKRWDPNNGDKRSFQSFSDISKRYYTKDWENGVSWRINDENDGRTKKKLSEQARDAGKDLGMLDDRVAAVLITGTADTVTMKSGDIPTCIDGYAYFSSSHEEHSSGNIVSGGGVGTTSAVKTDWFKVIRRYTELKFPRNRQPYFKTGDVHRARYVVFVSPENYEVFCEAFELKDRVVIVQNAAGSDNVAATSVSNVMQTKFGQAVTLVSYNRISGNDWFVFMDAEGRSRKPFLKDEIQGVNEVFYDETNSDESRNHKSRAIAWDVRRRYAYLNWNVAIKVDN